MRCRSSCVVLVKSNAKPARQRLRNDVKLLKYIYSSTRLGASVISRKLRIRLSCTSSGCPSFSIVCTTNRLTNGKCPFRNGHPAHDSYVMQAYIHDRFLLLIELSAFVGFHHVLMIIIVASWVSSCSIRLVTLSALCAVTDATTALLLASCTTDAGAFNDFYVISLSYQTSSDASSGSKSLFQQASKGGMVTARSGYFGLCAKRDSSGRGWICDSGTFRAQSTFAAGGVDPLDLVNIAANFKNDVLYPGLM